MFDSFYVLPPLCDLSIKKDEMVYDLNQFRIDFNIIEKT